MMWRPIPAYELDPAPLPQLIDEIEEILDSVNPRRGEVLFILRRFYPDGEDGEVEFYPGETRAMIQEVLENPES